MVLMKTIIVITVITILLFLNVYEILGFVLRAFHISGFLNLGTSGILNQIIL